MLHWSRNMVLYRKLTFPQKNDYSTLDVFLQTVPLMNIHACKPLVIKECLLLEKTFRKSVKTAKVFCIAFIVYSTSFYCH